MNASKIIAAAALSLLAAAGAQAETYDGVHRLVSANSRSQVNAEAVVAARSANPYSEGYGASAAPIVVGQADRATVRAGAVVAAHSADPYAEGYAANVAPNLASTVDRATVRAQAREAARGINQAAL
jgi:hypothetical protein